jgi:hypothetical protein
MIYVDTIRHYPHCHLHLPHRHWCHLATDRNLEELHTFAARLGLDRSWFRPSESGRFPHYDLLPSTRERALQLGATPVSPVELMRLCYPDVWGQVTMQRKE